MFHEKNIGIIYLLILPSPITQLVQDTFKSSVFSFLRLFNIGKGALMAKLPDAGYIHVTVCSLVIHFDQISRTIDFWRFVSPEIISAGGNSRIFIGSDGTEGQADVRPRQMRFSSSW